MAWMTLVSPSFAVRTSVASYFLEESFDTLMAGTVNFLPAGSYTVKLANNQALFTSESGKKFTVPVKVSNDSSKKYDATEVRTAKDGETNVIQAIDLGGTTEELQFGE